MDRLYRKGAAVKNLDHRPSLAGTGKSAPSTLRMKHLRLPGPGDSGEEGR
jgi:hypothetical protein